MRAQEKVQVFNNDAAGTKTAVLQGGRYVLQFIGTGAGTVDLKALGPDGVTLQAVMTQITASGVSPAMDLPPGTYSVVVASFTANYVTLIRVPME